MLSQFIEKNGGRLKEGTIKFIAYQIILAIGDLHRKGIMYRNLTEDSVIIDEMLASVQIGDFRNARKVSMNEVVHEDINGNQLCYEYMAPEMVTNSGHDKIVDWWALGILIYKMLFGYRPFQGKNKDEAIAKIEK